MSVQLRAAASLLELFVRQFRGRVADLGPSATRDTRRVLVETHGWPLRAEVEMRELIASHDVRPWLNRIYKHVQALRRPDPYARRDAFPLCLQHVGWCPRCHGS